MLGTIAFGVLSGGVTYLNSKKNDPEPYNFISGRDFKQKYPNYKPVKIVKNNFQYKIGLNENVENDLYFTSVENIPNFYEECGDDAIAFIELLDDENIWIENGKCKTNKFKITEIKSISNFINDLTELQQLRFLKKNSSVIEHIKNQTTDFQLKAIEINPYCIGHLSEKEAKFLELHKFCC